MSTHLTRALRAAASTAITAGAGLVVVVALGLAGCGQAATHAPGRTSTPSRPAPSTSASSVPVTTPARPSAAGQLAAFFTAAEYADSQIRDAAALINGDIGATSMRFTPATLAAVRALNIGPAAQAIPAGLPAGLLQATLTVYGDLSSRAASLHGVELYGYSGRALPTGSPDAKGVLRCLGNGAPAAARFAADLAAARSLAQQTPPITVAPAESRAAAELAVRIYAIDLPNICSYDCGGYAPTQLEPITWQPPAGPAHYQGTIGGATFHADYTPARGWQVSINAC